MRSSRIVRRMQNESGAAAVEFALVVIFLMMLVAAAIEFSSAYTQLQILTGAAREGARAAAVRMSVTDVQARIDGTIPAPFKRTNPATVTVGSTSYSGGTKPCDLEANRGLPVQVKWNQTFNVSIAGANFAVPPVSISGTFRCE